MKISSQMTFLIVDDYSSVRSMVKQMLRDMGFKGDLLEAANVADAKKILIDHQKHENKVEFIISDWLMPEGSGLDFCIWVRSEQDFQDLPFLILTTENEKDRVVESIANGASNYLLKPWNKDSLTDKINKCWEKHHGQD